MIPDVRRNGPFQQRRCGRSRRAVVAVVVLLLIAVALATSYTAMRSQTVTLNVRQNAMLGVSARRAALTGLTAGLREMHSPDWLGVETTFSRSLSANESFNVEYIAGDSGLTIGDADYEELPYRVTLAVTGIAYDPSDSRRVSQHTLRAVARLVPRAMPGEPSDWSSMQERTFYQTKDYRTTLDLPCRIEGSIRLQGKLQLGHNYPDDWYAWVNYFYHLSQMRLNGYGDHRTLTGRVYYDYGKQDGYVHDTLVVYMGVSTTHQIEDTANSDWSKPTCLTSYRLFPGGPEYEVPSLPVAIANRTLASSTADNPLGLVYANSNLTIGDNVTIHGTIMCREHLRIEGDNVQIESVDILPLEGESLSIQIPAVTCKSLEVRAGASCSVKGLVAVFGDLDVAPASARGRLTVTGKVIAEDLDILQDTDWDALDWEDEFDDYLHVNGPAWIYFPVWMRIFGYSYEPTVHIKPGEDFRYHWYRPGESLFVPHPDDFSEMDAGEDPGLRWELIEISHEGS